MALDTRRRTVFANSKHCISLLARLAAKNALDTSTPLFRRESYRWALEAPAAIRYQPAGSDKVTVEATVADLSSTGIGLLCAQALTIGQQAEVFVSAEGKTYSAAIEVTHTTPMARGYRIGCEFSVQETE